VKCTKCGQYITPEIGCVCIGDKDDQGDMFDNRPITDDEIEELEEAVGGVKL